MLSSYKEESGGGGRDLWVSDIIVMFPGVMVFVVSELILIWESQT